MPELNASTFSLDDKSPAELEFRRREIRDSLLSKYKGYDDPDVPEELLRELAAITATLRRRTSGPPKTVKKPTTSKVKATTASLLADLG